MGENVESAEYGADEWRSEFSDLLFALGWRSRSDRFSPARPNSPTFVVLNQLAGASRVRWGEFKGIDLAVAATARGDPEQVTPARNRHHVLCAMHYEARRLAKHPRAVGCRMRG